MLRKEMGHRRGAVALACSCRSLRGMGTAATDSQPSEGILVPRIAHWRGSIAIDLPKQQGALGRAPYAEQAVEGEGQPNC
jgi:hypothetical protein